MRINPRVKIVLLAVILLAAVFIGISKGSSKITLLELFNPSNQKILQLRIARVILGILVGSGLAVCGVALQAILKNPLAEPYLLGTSSGAGLGAVSSIFLGLSAAYIPIYAFLGALLSIVFVYNLAREGNRIPIQSLILSGVIVGVASSGIVIFLVSLSPNEALHGILWWILGNLQVYDLKLLVTVGIIVLSGIAALIILSQDLNAISLGEQEAIHLGINAESLKKILFLITALITGALVSISGIIGFVGLIIPHIMRLIVGPNHKVLIPATALAAAAFLVLCDTLARTLFAPVEVPIGVITSLIGAPVFIVLMKKGRKVK